MSLTAGTRLGPYEILGPLGAGGMGEVYRARDPRLGREVAIKVLPTESLRDPSARARLLREARLAATLNHPNICTVFEVGEAEGQVYIALELIEGQPLSAKIAERTAGLATESVVRYGAQIAAALSHAHERHVIHRDLKASNVLVTSDGRVKVLDFGLARRRWEAPEESGETLSMALTGTGAVVGTPHYLAPEVLHGGKADERSDLWALGVMLHEMASGTLPFRGATSFALASSILHDVPARLPERVPAGLRAVVGRCLAKEPGERYQRASEVSAALDTIHSASSGVAVAATPSRSSRRPAVVAVLVVVAAIATFAALKWRPAAHRELRQRQLTSNPAGDPVGTGNISPDGKTLAVVDRTGLSLRSIESGESHALELPAGFSFAPPIPHIDWFPDGSQLLVSGVMADGRPAVWALPVTGGRMRKLLDDAWCANLSPDGNHIAYRGDRAGVVEIWVCGANGEGAYRVTGDDSSGRIPGWAAWSPNGKRLAYCRIAVGAQGVRQSLESCDLSGRVREFFVAPHDRPLHYTTIPAWLPDGRVLFGLTDPPPSQRDLNLWSLKVNPRSGVPSGSPRRVTQWQGLALVIPTACSADGRRLSIGALGYQSDVFVGRIGAVGTPLEDVRRLTHDDRMDVSPAWMPDDSSIVFASDRNGTYDLYRQRLGSDFAEALVTGPGDQISPHPSPDHAWILYLEGDATGSGSSTTRTRLMRLPVAGGPPQKVLDLLGIASIATPRSAGASPVLCEMQKDTVVFWAFDALRGRGPALSRYAAHETPVWDLSPDGATIAMIVSSQDSIPTIRVFSARNGPSREIRLEHPVQIARIAFTADGRSWLAIAYDGRWQLMQIDGRGHSTPLIPPQLWMYSAAASPDGKRVAYTSNTGQGNIWMLEDF